MWRKKLKNLGIIIVFSAVVFVLSSILLLTYAFKREATAILEGAPELIVQRVVGGRHSLIPVEYTKKIKEIPGIGKIIPRIWGYYYDPSTGGNYTFIGVEGVEKEQFRLLKGSFIEGSDSGVCVIGSGIAESHFVDIGGRIPIKGPNGRAQIFRIKGIFEHKSSILTNDLFIISQKDIKRLFEIPEGYATDMIVQVFNPQEVDNIASKIRAFLPDTRPITKKEILRTYDTLFDWRSGMILTAFAGAILAFIILAWDKATGLSAEEKREIGILKAIGWETSDVLELRFWEGFVISSVSFLSGLIGGYIHVFVFGASIFSPALKGWSVIFPEFRLIPFINPYQIIVLLFFTVIPYMASTIVPSWKAAITDPDTVMRT